MHLAGLAGEPRHYAQLYGIQNAATALLAHVIPLQRHITYAAVVLVASQVLFLVNLAISYRKGSPASENPWTATTLEWAPALPAGEERRVFCSPCVYLEPLEPPSATAFRPQWSAQAIPE